MGIYYFDARFISRSKQSAVAKAAYISNEAIYSERDEEVKKYRNRTVKPDSFIIAPQHAPEWVYNRERLWNEVEKVEKQYNSQLAREIVVALPIELKKDDQNDLIREYVQENFVADGMVADVNIHRDQEHNPHAHILLTVRPFKENGEWFESKTKKEYIFDEQGNPVLNDKGVQKTRNIDLTGWNNKNKLLSWRENYAKKVNEIYKMRGIKKSISHLSYEEQGKDIKARHRLTRSEYYVEKKAKEKALANNQEYIPVTTYGKINKEIEDYNREIKSLQNEIEQLEKLKSNYKEINVSKFEDIRNNYKLTNEEFNSIKFIKKRQKTGYVDYEIATTALDSIKYWKKSIDKKIRALNREEEALNTVRDLYEKGDKKIQKYGFVEEDFVKRFNSKMDELNEKYGKLTNEVSQYKESFKLVKQGHELQKDLLSKEFEYLYPQYKEFTSVDSFELNELKNKYVSLFKNENKVYEVISEFESYDLFSTAEEQEFRDVIWDTVTDYRNESKQHFSLAKKLDKLEQEYLQVANDNLGKNNEKLDDVYKKAITYLATKREYNLLNKEYEKTKNVMFNSLIELYGEQQKEVIEKVPDRIKLLLLERFLKERYIGGLSSDLKEVNWTIREDKQIKFKEGWKENNDFNYMPQTINNNSMGNLLSDLIESAKQNEGKYDDLEYKRKKAKRRKKLTKEEILELE
ncbi:MULTISPECIES: MobQ family relaxase [Bacillus]|uniref:MobQ family relaxase n=1 Tax=Bacillus TaxID=1386 RepID=UPI0013EECE47|nr:MULTISPECIES: MobQ family relaxase [Bacillus]QII26969.1 MobA/MobL family protein [Bacillus altitudinis]